jgi:hypothetical protein
MVSLFYDFFFHFLVQESIFLRMPSSLGSRLSKGIESALGLLAKMLFWDSIV